MVNTERGLTKKQYEKWKAETESVREHFLDVCRKILKKRYIEDKDFADKFFEKSKMTASQLYEIIRNKRDINTLHIKTIVEKLDIYYALLGE